MKVRTFAILVVFTLCAGTILTGCSRETDPHQTYNEPGYYNGPMKPHGGGAANAGKADTGAKAGG